MKHSLEVGMERLDHIANLAAKCEELANDNAGVFVAARFLHPVVHHKSARLYHWAPRSLARLRLSDSLIIIAQENAQRLHQRLIVPDARLTEGEDQGDNQTVQDALEDGGGVGATVGDPLLFLLYNAKKLF
jgi:hypothetical protein